MYVSIKASIFFNRGVIKEEKKTRPYRLVFSRRRNHSAGESRARRDQGTLIRALSQTLSRRRERGDTLHRRRRTTTGNRIGCLPPRRQSCSTNKLLSPALPCSEHPFCRFPQLRFGRNKQRRSSRERGLMM